jgi:Putative Flp pilus-assembly TadE/G-like
VLIGFVALGVDTGVLYSAKTTAQSVADAAALAGAFTYVNTPSAAQPSTASTNAIQVAINNTVMGKPVTAADVTVTSDVANRKVTVTVKSKQNTYFARALGLKIVDVSATATAEAAEFAEGSSCVKPWFLPNTALSTSATCTAGCSGTETLINPSTREVTAFAYSKIGSQFSVKPQDPSGALGPGNFYAINFPGGHGASDYRDAIGYCKSPYLRCGEYQEPKSGNMVGPTKQGVEILIGNPPRFTWIAPGQYRQVSDSKAYDLSENVILAPIWNVCGSQFCATGKQKNDVPIIGFATIFIEGIKGDDVVARLVGVSSCGAVLGGPTGGTTHSFPLRLVR